MPVAIVPETFQAYPMHRLLGIVHDSEAADRIIEGLDELGLSKDLWVVTGNDATQVLDPDGAQHGLWARLVRAVQQLGYEAMQFAEYEAAAQAGAWVLAVQLTGAEDQKNAVRDLFARHGGRNLRFFGTFGIEDVHLNAPVPAVSVAETKEAKREVKLAAAEMVSEGGPVEAGKPAPKG